MKATCGECEHFGLYDKVLFSDEWVETTGPGGIKIFMRPALGLDRSAGALCACPARTGTPCRVYDKSVACWRFKPRTWTAAEDCVNCDLRVGQMQDGVVRCSGWPFTNKETVDPCENGRAAIGGQLRMV